MKTNNKITAELEFKLPFWKRILFLFSGSIQHNLTIYFTEYTNVMTGIRSSYGDYEIEEIKTNDDLNIVELPFYISPLKK